MVGGKDRTRKRSFIADQMQVNQGSNENEKCCILSFYTRNTQLRSSLKEAYLVLDEVTDRWVYKVFFHTRTVLWMSRCLINFYYTNLPGSRNQLIQILALCDMSGLELLI